MTGAGSVAREKFQRVDGKAQERRAEGFPAMLQRVDVATLEHGTGADSATLSAFLTSRRLFESCRGASTLSTLLSPRLVF